MRPLTLAAALLALTLGLAAAQSAPDPAPACPERDIQIEQPGVGNVSADALDSDGDTVVLTGACFVQRGLRFETPELRAQGGVVRASALTLTGAGLSGAASSAALQGDRFALAGLSLDLSLPDRPLGDLPLPTGRYHLNADAASFGEGGALSLGSATLRALDGGAVYRLEGAVYAGSRLRAHRAVLGRLDAQDLTLAPGRLTAGGAVIGLCRDPQTDELQLATGPLSVTPGGTLAQDARLRVLGADLLSTRTLALPITAGSGTLEATVQGLEPGVNAFAARLGSPSLVAGGGSYGVRDLFFLDPYDTRFNLVYHPGYLEAGTSLNLGASRLRFGVFEDPDVTDTSLPLAEAVLVSRDPLGPGYALALRTPDRLSEARLGYGGALGPLGYRADIGLGRQNGVSAAFGHANLHLERSLSLGALSLGGLADANSYLFGVGPQVALTLQGSASLQAGAFGVSLTQLERQVWGADPLPDLSPDPARLTTASVSYAPSLPGNGLFFTGASYTVQYDWLAHDFSESLLTASARSETPTSVIAPRAFYDFHEGRVGVGADLLRQNACFAYGVGVDLSVQPRVANSFKIQFGLRFNLR